MVEKYVSEQMYHIEVCMQETQQHGLYAVYLFIGVSLLMSAYGTEEEMKTKYDSICNKINYEESIS